MSLAALVHIHTYIVVYVACYRQLLKMLFTADFIILYVMLRYTILYYNIS